MVLLLPLPAKVDTTPCAPPSCSIRILKLLASAMKSRLRAASSATCCGLQKAAEAPGPSAQLHAPVPASVTTLRSSADSCRMRWLLLSAT